MSGVELASVLANPGKKSSVALDAGGKPVKR
jgi:hypothetical protein